MKKNKKLEKQIDNHLSNLVSKWFQDFNNSHKVTSFRNFEDYERSYWKHFIDKIEEEIEKTEKFIKCNSSYDILKLLKLTALKQQLKKEAILSGLQD